VILSHPNIVSRIDLKCPKQTQIRKERIEKIDALFIHQNEMKYNIQDAAV
jgi:hypothetical protein